ncbi:hypothetical protein ACXJJ3_10395 [Kribbella sp. WER1]
MIDDLGKLLDKVSSPGDLAVLLLSGPLAFLLDAGLDVLPFLPPGYVAIVAASLSLGIKKALRRLVGLLDVPEGLTIRLRHELDLYDARITTDDQFEAALDECLTEYRSLVTRQIDSGVPEPRR